MIHEDRGLLAELARLNRDMAFLGAGAVDPVPAEGALMAATAKACKKGFVTRNVADVERTGGCLLDPWQCQG